MKTALALAALALLPTACVPESPARADPPAMSKPAKPEATPTAELDRLDTRKPVPLLPMMADHQKQNMRDHLAAVQEIVAAVATDDFPAVERAAGRLGFSEQMGMMCTHMGAGAPGFTEQALAFHHQADRIGEAAKKKDRTRVLAELGTTLKTCTACHATWKQQIVDEPTWTRLTGSPSPHAGGAMP